MVNRHILVVEDEPTLRRIVVEALERSGYEVSSAGDGEEGLHLFESHCADLVVADIMMPRMDGFEMVRRMRTRMNIPFTPAGGKVVADGVLFTYDTTGRRVTDVRRIKF